MTKKLLDWFGSSEAIWKGTCTKCGKVLTHRGTEPTQKICNRRNCKGVIIWQIDEV